MQIGFAVAERGVPQHTMMGLFGIDLIRRKRQALRQIISMLHPFDTEWLMMTPVRCVNLAGRLLWR
jgi:hypothetical protein